MTDRETQSAAIARQIFLRSFSAGRPLGSAAGYLAQVMSDELFTKGTALYRKGDTADLLFFVVRGRVRLSVAGAEPWLFGAGSVIGLLDVLQDRPHARTAEAMTDVHALVLRADDYFDVLEDNFEFTRTTIINMADAIHSLRLALAPTGGFKEGTRVLPASERAPRSVRAPPSSTLGPGPSMNLVDRTITLREVPALASAGIQALTTMAGLVDEVRLSAGKSLYAEGDPSPAIFLVARGSVEIERSSPVLRATFGPSSLLGGYASLASTEQPYTARALAPSLALRLDKEDLFDLLEIHFELVRSIFKNMAIEREQALLERAARNPKSARGGGGSAGLHVEADPFAV